MRVFYVERAASRQASHLRTPGRCRPAQADRTPGNGHDRQSPRPALRRGPRRTCDGLSSRGQAAHAIGRGDKPPCHSTHPPASSPLQTITVDDGTEFHGYRHRTRHGPALLLRNALPLLGARHEREHERAHSPVHPETLLDEAVDAGRCTAIALKLNNRPRKRHAFLSPLEVLAARLEI